MDDNDHRHIANRMHLFHQQEEAPGMVFWHPRGFVIYRIIEDYIRTKMRTAGFCEVRTPQLLSRSLWERSGHWDKFGTHIYTLGDAEHTLALKPMSCPAHVQIFNKRVRSFRDLPIRLCEFGACHRDEPSGSLHGIMRTRAFIQDDAHIFCSETDVEREIAQFCALLNAVYADFGFANIRVAFSTRPSLRAGSASEWDSAEAKLESAARYAGLDYEVDPGEGAFYGPKLDFFLRDNQDREWQCGTIQLDLVLPARLDALYVDARGQRVRPVMIHHAVLGSLERFVGVLLEHYQGNLPLWLAPDQIVVASITQTQAPYANDVCAALARAGYRAVTDNRSERLPRKIVDARNDGIPVMMVVGERERRDGTVSVRKRHGDQQTLSVAAAASALESDAFPESEHAARSAVARA